MEIIKQVPVTVEKLVQRQKVTLCVEVYCSVLQCATVCLQSGDYEARAGDSGNARAAQQSHSYLQQCVAVCCSVLH